uniref:Uncharacterized protein n=1 Tax=Romanomermis culicivorax TaxID=13658 RepID=A0A915HFI7_ROMCU
MLGTLLMASQVGKSPCKSEKWTTSSTDICMEIRQRRWRDLDPNKVASAGNLLSLGDRDQQWHAVPDPMIPDQTPARVQPLQPNSMHFTPQDVGIPLDRPPAIAIDPQEAGPVNRNSDADGPPP